MKTTMGLIAIGLIQSVGGVFLYRGRVLLHASWLDSDIIVFLLPFLVGAAVCSLFLWKRSNRSQKVNRLTVAVLGGAGAAAVAEYVRLLVAFNLYGT